MMESSVNRRLCLADARKCLLLEMCRTENSLRRPPLAGGRQWSGRRCSLRGTVVLRDFVSQNVK
jgi:hypothetical protein